MKVAKTGASTTVLADLLELVGEPVNMSGVERFVARDKFVIDRHGELPIRFLGGNFKDHFLDLVEENVPARILKQRKLQKPSPDAPVLNALGDKDLNKIEKARIALAHTFDFLKTARRFSETTGRAQWYRFYVADTNGILWALRVIWNDGWHILAYPPTDPCLRGADAGSLVVSS